MKNKIFNTINKTELKNNNLKFLVNKYPEKQAELVNGKICQTLKKGDYTFNNYLITVVEDPTIIETKNGTIGYEVYAKVWKNGEQLGFGVDGSVEIERFRIYGFSAYLIEDNAGDVEITHNGFIPSRNQNISIVKKYREDLLTSILNDLTHTISLVGKTGTNIEIGKIGKTVDTFNPLRIAGVRSGTGYFANNTSGGNFAAWRGPTSSSNMSNTGLDPDFCYIQMEKTGASTYGWNVRTWGVFDTSSIPDSNVISSAVLSIKPDGSIFGGPTDPLTGTKLGVTAFSPTDKRSIVAADIDNFADTRFATDINWSSLVSGTYADFTLNASGISNINVTGDSAFFWRMNWDIDNSAPGATSGNTGTGFAFGVTNPQKLVVTHSAGAAANTTNFFMLRM